MDNIYGDQPGSNTPVDDQKPDTALSVQDVLRGHEQVISKLNILSEDVQILLVTAKLIRTSVSEVHRAARNPIAQQTNEEWLRAYDSAEMAKPMGVL